jgi:hypothetical protein
VRFRIIHRGRRRAREAVQDGSRSFHCPDRSRLGSGSAGDSHGEFQFLYDLARRKGADLNYIKSAVPGEAPFVIDAADMRVDFEGISDSSGPGGESYFPDSVVGDYMIYTWRLESHSEQRVHAIKQFLHIEPERRH